MPVEDLVFHAGIGQFQRGGQSRDTGADDRHPEVVGEFRGAWQHRLWRLESALFQQQRDVLTIDGSAECDRRDSREEVGVVGAGGVQRPGACSAVATASTMAVLVSGSVVPACSGGSGTWVISGAKRSTTLASPVSCASTATSTPGRPEADWPAVRPDRHPLARCGRLSRVRQCS